MLLDKKNILLYFFTKFKTNHISYFYFYITLLTFVDPNSMQKVCHMNFMMDLSHHGVSVAQW